MDSDHLRELQRLFSGAQGHPVTQELLEASRARLDTTLDFLQETRDVCADLTRLFEEAKAEIDDPDLLAEVDERRRPAYQEGCRCLNERVPRDAA